MTSTDHQFIANHQPVASVRFRKGPPVVRAALTEVIGGGHAAPESLAEIKTVDHGTIDGVGLKEEPLPAHTDDLE